MATTTPKVLIQSKYAENSLTEQYEAENCKAVIDVMTATNVHTANVVFSVHLVANGGSATAANRVVDERQIAPGESYHCPEVVGHWLESGQTIHTVCDTASAIVMRASGRERTA